MWVDWRTQLASHTQTLARTHERRKKHSKCHAVNAHAPAHERTIRVFAIARVVHQDAAVVATVVGVHEPPAFVAVRVQANPHTHGDIGVRGRRDVDAGSEERVPLGFKLQLQRWSHGASSTNRVWLCTFSEGEQQRTTNASAVSYTHLTLPTIYSV